MSLMCPAGNVRIRWEADIEQNAPACDHARMNRSQAIAAAKHFLATVWGDEPPSDEALLSALNRLVAAYHETPQGDVTDAEIDAPRQDGASLYKQVAERFPAYGYYPVADPAKSLDDALMTADAINDLADLTLDSNNRRDRKSSSYFHSCVSPNL